LRDLESKYQAVLDVAQSQPKVQAIEPKTGGQWVTLILLFSVIFTVAVGLPCAVSFALGRELHAERAVKSAAIISSFVAIVGGVSLFKEPKLFGSVFERLFEDLFKITFNEVAAIPPLEITVEVAAPNAPDRSAPKPPSPPPSTEAKAELRIDCGEQWPDAWKPVYEFQHDGDSNGHEDEIDKIHKIGEQFARSNRGKLLDAIIIMGSANKKRIDKGNDLLVKARIDVAKDYVAADKSTWASSAPGDISGRIITFNSAVGSRLRIRAGPDNQQSIAFDTLRGIMICTVWSTPKSDKK
jgi:hypothetical protein